MTKGRLLWHVAQVPYNKQLERTVIRRRGRAAAQLRRYVA